LNNDTKSQVSSYSQSSNQTSVSAVTYATEALGITDQTSFLLLDLRDPDEYDFWRIKESINYPAANIGRDKIIPELFRFKNNANKLIIIYMGDERKGTAAANLMSEKGYENVFLLSGGIE
jgi:centrosomal protein CEP41